MRRMFLVVAALAVIVAAADFGLWVYAVNRVESLTASWADAQRSHGWVISYGPVAREGWPLAARIRVANFNASNTLPAPISYTADHALIGVSLLAPQRLVVDLEGRQRLQASTAPEFSMTADRTELTMPLDQNAPPLQADLAIDSGHMTLEGNGAAVVAEKLRLHIDFPTPSVSFTLDAGPIDLPQGAAGTQLGPRIDRVRIQASAMLPTPGMTAAAWRDTGGTAAVRQFILDWGNLKIDASAALRLDDKLQPTGQGNACLTGTDEAVDALSASHIVAPRAAAAAKAILSLLARPRPQGPPAVDVPWTVQDRTLQIGKFPIARLPEIIW